MLDTSPRSASRKATLAFLLAAACGLAQAAPPIPLRIVVFNDLHGHLESGGLTLSMPDPSAPGKTLRVPAGGLANMAGLVKALRAEVPNTLVYSGGDLFGASPLVSTLFKHESTIEAVNAMGLDGAVLGNHEFDAGIMELRRLADGGCLKNEGDFKASCALHRYEGARFPLIAFNVRDANDQQLFSQMQLERAGNADIGVVGAITKNAAQVMRPSAASNLRFNDEAAAINQAASEFKERGINIVVALVHEGGEVGTASRPASWADTSCKGARGPIFDIARKLSKDVDVVFSAHTHQAYRCVVDGRLIVQAPSLGRGVTVVDMSIDPDTKRPIAAKTRSAILPVLSEKADPALRSQIAAALPASYGKALRSAKPDATVAQIVKQYADLAAPKASRVLGQISGAFEHGHGDGADSTAGRLVADAQLAATRAADQGGAQIAFTNPGGIRSDLACAKAPCDVNYGQAFAMQPFGNNLVVMSLTGAQVKTALESQYRKGSTTSTFLQPSQGLTYTWNGKANGGERVQDLKLDGKPVVPTQAYRVTVNSFLAEGGDGFSVFKQGTDRRNGPLDVDALAEFIKTKPAPVAQARVRVAGS